MLITTASAASPPSAETRLKQALGGLESTVKIEPVEIYSDASSMAVMRHPGRRFPGSLIQGDSLSLLAAEAQELYAAVAGSENEELVALALEHKEKLEEHLAEYERVICSHGVELPYSKHAQQQVQGPTSPPSAGTRP